MLLLAHPHAPPPRPPNSRHSHFTAHALRCDTTPHSQAGGQASAGYTQAGLTWATSCGADCDRNRAFCCRRGHRRGVAGSIAARQFGASRSPPAWPPRGRRAWPQWTSQPSQTPQSSQGMPSTHSSVRMPVWQVRGNGTRLAASGARGRGGAPRTSRRG